MGSDAESLTIQVGAHDNQTITINLSKIDSNTLGLNGFSVANKQPAVGAAVTELGVGSAAPVAPDLSAAATALGSTVDVKDLTLHNVLDASGNATSQYAVKHGDKLYAATVSNGAVSLTTTDATITDNTIGSSGTSVSLSGALIQIGVNSSGATAGFISYQGKNYATASLGSTATTISIAKDGTSDELFKGTATGNPLAALDSALQKVRAP